MITDSFAHIIMPSMSLYNWKLHKIYIEINLSLTFGSEKVKSIVLNPRELLGNSAGNLTQSVNESSSKCHSILHLRVGDIIFLCLPYILSSINYRGFTMAIVYTRHHLICVFSVSSATLSSTQNSSLCSVHCSCVQPLLIFTCTAICVSVH